MEPKSRFSELASFLVVAVTLYGIRVCVRLHLACMAKNPSVEQMVLEASRCSLPGLLNQSRWR